MQDQIDEIMEWFDFERVHKAMVALDWRWNYWIKHGNSHIPSLEEIKAFAQRQLKLVSKPTETEYNHIHSGGFRASNKDGVLSLEFIVDSWEATNE